MTDALRWMPLTLNLHLWRRAIVILVAALVVVQTVGVLHRVAHAHQSAGLAGHVASENTRVFAAVWGEHSHSVECQLFDQACPDLLDAPVWTWPVAMLAFLWRVAALSERFALFERFYAARGPPVALI